MQWYSTKYDFEETMIIVTLMEFMSISSYMVTSI
jgi:hypothetical protein